jgi:hypothetical protein
MIKAGRGIRAWFVDNAWTVFRAAILLFLVVVVIAYTKDCDEVCADAGLRSAGEDCHTLFACSCVPETKRGEVEFHVSEAYGTASNGRSRSGRPRDEP